MTLTDTIKKLVGDFIRDMMSVTLERIDSNGREPITLQHVSGAVVELRDDGEVYINGEIPATSAALNNVVEDLSPQLGGDLDCNGKDIVGVTEISTSSYILFTKV